MNTLTVHLDKIANSLEARGLIKEALEIDRVADSMDKVAAATDVAQQVSNLLGLNRMTSMNLRDVIRNHMNVILDVITKHLPNAGKQDEAVTNNIMSLIKRCDQQINSLKTNQATTPAAPASPTAPAGSPTMVRK
jgi:hypothetical protein